MKIIPDGSVTSPKGFKAVGAHVGIKKKKKDIAIIYSEAAAKVAGTFTTNLVQAAPVVWDKKLVETYPFAKAIAINSGVANACTGEEGMKLNKEFASIVADTLEITKEEVYVCSTGVIGRQLPMETIKVGIPTIIERLDDTVASGHDVAEAIMTTDTAPKEVAVTITINETIVTMGACCKGSGMIHPDMATMLGFITTDLKIDKVLLNTALKEVIKDTFNMVSVDRDTSTNDTVLLFANGLANNPEITEENEAYQIFKEALFFICESLAKQIAADGEGATKLLEVQVHEASTKEKAKNIAKSVCASPLVKTAVFGSDANWGRILCAMGYAKEAFDPNLVALHIVSDAGELQLVDKGMALDYSEEKATEILSSKEVTAHIYLNNGNEEATAWGCDLTYDYVKINGDYRS